jgi:hypothetical protein
MDDAQHIDFLLIDDPYISMVFFSPRHMVQQNA